MIIETSRFGKINYNRSEIITLVREIPGFENQLRFILVSPEGHEPFEWFQSLDDPSLAFLLIDPLYFKPDYAAGIEPDDLVILEPGESGEIAIFVLVSIPREDPELMSANLLAPLAVNKSNMYGAQLVLDESGHSTELLVLGEITGKLNDSAVGNEN